MQTLEISTYTRLQLYWELCKYRQEFNGAPISDRTFRHWKQKLGIVPDHLGLYWQSDLERLKDTARRLSQGQSLDQIAQMFQEHVNNATAQRS